MPNPHPDSPANGRLRRAAIAAFALGLLGVSATRTEPLHAQVTPGTAPFTRADTLRGTLGPERLWWDVHFYDLAVRIDPKTRRISGANAIHFRAVDDGQVMQIDLQRPMELVRASLDGTSLKTRRDGNAHFVELPRAMAAGEEAVLLLEFEGEPTVAPNAPWDGGFVWTRDGLGRPWVATANQGHGASMWWPNKDHQSEEPDSMLFSMTVPDPMVAVGNGRLREKTPAEEGWTTWSWFVGNPINNYNIAVNAGSFVHFGETYEGLDGTLDLDYWVLEEDLGRARRQFVQVRPMLECFEEWFGPYPFYGDSFKMVQTPYLGMEHQSAIAYGNGYQNGYLGRDLSGTGWGLMWDFIIIHEAGHEWFGNNITTADVADMWVHEGFTNYTENIFTECLAGPQAGAEYVIGSRALIMNDRPIIGPYGVNREGSSDMYYKGGNILHTLRQVADDDALWKGILRGMNQEFWHQIVTSAEIEDYVSEQMGRDLSPIFDQYLRKSRIPVLEMRTRDGALEYRWDADVDGFDLPVRIAAEGGSPIWIEPITGEWRSTRLEAGGPESVMLDPNFLARVHWVE
jgi:aminopeptidase N